MQDHLQQTAVMNHRRSLQKPFTENTVSKTKEDAAHEAMEALTSARARQEDARSIYEQKCNEAAVAETNFSNAMDVLGQAGALEKHHKTLTMPGGQI